MITIAIIARIIAKLNAILLAIRTIVDLEFVAQRKAKMTNKIHATDSIERIFRNEMIGRTNEINPKKTATQIATLYRNLKFKIKHDTKPTKAPTRTIKNKPISRKKPDASVKQSARLRSMLETTTVTEQPIEIARKLDKNTLKRSIIYAYPL